MIISEGNGGCHGKIGCKWNFVIGKINHKMEVAIGIIHGGFIGKINYLYVYTNRDLG
jgi:hypothetical protein